MHTCMKWLFTVLKVTLHLIVLVVLYNFSAFNNHKGVVLSWACLWTWCIVTCIISVPGLCSGHPMHFCNPSIQSGVCLSHTSVQPASLCFGEHPHPTLLLSTKLDPGQMVWSPSLSIPTVALVTSVPLVSDPVSDGEEVRRQNLVAGTGEGNGKGRWTVRWRGKTRSGPRWYIW